MLAVVFGLVAFGLVQETEIPRIGMADARPTRECAVHLTAPRARRDCMNDLYTDAANALEAANHAAADEARDIDLTSGGLFGAERALDDARSAWAIYRDAECARRASLMMITDESRDEIVQDCRIVLTRARAAELRDN